MEDLKTFSDPVDKMSQSSSQKGSQNSTSSLGSTISGGTLNESLFSQAAMSQRIVTVEYYMSPPVKEFDNLYSEFRNSSVKKVPIIRIFGTTSAGWLSRLRPRTVMILLCNSSVGWKEN